MKLFTILNQYTIKSKASFNVLHYHFNLRYLFLLFSLSLLREKILFQNSSSLFRKNVAIKLSVRTSIFAHRSEILSQSEYLTIALSTANYAFL